MELSDAITIASIFAPYIYKTLSKKINSFKSQNSKHISESISAHITEVVNWANSLDFFGVNPLDTNNMTIGLNLATEPRKFQSAQQQTPKNELDLITESFNILLLGEPGSGKSTTFKRLALHILQSPPTNELDMVQYPIVIRLRELKDWESLFNRIASIFGLSIVPTEIITRRPAVDIHKRSYIEEIKTTEYRIDNERVQDVVATFLNDSSALVLLDGLDEMGEEPRTRIREDIIELGRKLNKAKIIVSCRSGDNIVTMDGFNTFEICPLTDTQIKTIADRWLGPQNEEFIRNLKALPYYDVANRPLLLTQLLILFTKNGYLPEKPSQIYEKLVQLLLEEWDTRRRIRRVSKYAGFNPKLKANFLSSLAFQLMYVLNKASFQESDLIQAYKAIYNNFLLPESEAKEVAQEIQTHNGLILCGPNDTYEFCHLSLQEYLCADYIVRGGPLDSLAIAWYFRKPAPLAVTIALSSKPSNWFGNIIFSGVNLQNIPEQDMCSFLSRILVEQPVFQNSEILGFAILVLEFRYYNSPQVKSYLDRIIEMPNVFASVAAGLRWFNPPTKKIAPDMVLLNRKIGVVGTQNNVPTNCGFPTKYIPRLKEYGKEFYESFNNMINTRQK